MTSKITHKHKLYFIAFMLGFVTFRGLGKMLDSDYNSLIFDTIPALLAFGYWAYFEYILMREVDKYAGY